jgi:plasmid stabilization system protein ParE
LIVGGGNIEPPRLACFSTNSRLRSHSSITRQTSANSYRQSPIVGIRRVLLPRTRYHVYYVAREDVVLVLAVWHAKRGSGPPMRHR